MDKSRNTITQMWFWGFIGGAFAGFAITGFGAILAGNGLWGWAQMIFSIVMVAGTIYILLMARKADSDARRDT